MSKNMRYQVVLYLAVLLILAAVNADSAEPPTLVKISTGEYAPYTSQQATHGGFVNRVIRAAFAKQKMEVEFVYFPWKRALEEAAMGNFQASSFWFFDKERAVDFYYSDIISQHRELLFHLKSKSIPDWQSLEDLKAFTFGATLGYTYTKPFWDAAKEGKIQVQETRSDDINFKKLLAGRIDLFPMEEITGWQLVKKKYPVGADVLTTHPKPLSSSTGHLVFSKAIPGNEALLTQFNEGLKALKDSGEYDRFMSEFFEGIY